MSKKKQPFIIDENLSPAIKPYLPADSRTTVECGLKSGTQDYPFVLDLCQRTKTMLVTADIGFPRHIKRYQLAYNDCCWGLILLPGEEMKQVNEANTVTAYPLEQIQLLAHRDGHGLATGTESGDSIPISLAQIRNENSARNDGFSRRKVEGTAYLLQQSWVMRIVSPYLALVLRRSDLKAIGRIQ
jgi:hypothetical protein